MNQDRGAPRRDAVWLLDDSALERDVAFRALTDRYGVETFSDGAAMLEQLFTRRAPPDLLLVDYYMPGISGLDVCRVVRRTFNEARLPILVLTVSDDGDDLVECLSAGANDFATKPFNPAELRARVASLIRSKRIHETLEQAEAALRMEAELRERFVAILGHDLRQPIQTLLISAHALQRESLTPSAMANVRRVTGASQRMQRMVSDLLDFTRIRQGGGLPMSPEETDLHVIVRHVVDTLSLSHGERIVDLEVDGHGSGVWDRDRLAQLCGNLVGNALQYSPADTAVHVAVRDGDAGVELEVRNEGPPILPSLIPTLFDPFKQGERGQSKGLGLGLFIADQIARAHGGSIAVESDAMNTRFFVRLPRGDAHV